MGLWIPFTLLAAFMQAWRNAFQNRLSRDVSTAGVTLARFIWAGPLVMLYLWLLYSWEAVPMPQITWPFAGLILLAAIAQIIATVLMVMLFRQRNYAVGVGLAKSEAVIAAVLGSLFFAAPLSPLAWIGVVIGATAFWLMISPGALRTFSVQTLLTGLGSGLALALTTLWVREASLMLGLPFLYSAAWVLLYIIILQIPMLLGWLWWHEPHTLTALWQRPGQTGLISLFSCIGSLGWFTAMSLESVALVKTLGQVEVLFTLMISVCWFHESLNRRDLAGLALIVVGAVCVVLS